MRRYEMTSYSLVQAAEMARVSKATIWRLVKRGIVSASRAEDGSFRIEASEFERYLSSIAAAAMLDRYRSNSDASILNDPSSARDADTIPRFTSRQIVAFDTLAISAA